MAVLDPLAPTQFALEIAGRLAGYFTGIDGLGSEHEFAGRGRSHTGGIHKFAHNRPTRHGIVPMPPPAPPVPLASTGPMMDPRPVPPPTGPIPLPYSSIANLNPAQRRGQSPADIEKIFEDNKRTVGIRFFSVVDRTAMSTLSAYFEESVRHGAPLLALAIRAGRPERRYELRKARITGWSFAPSEQQAQSQTVKPTQLKIFVCPSDAGVGRLTEIPRLFWPAREGGIAIETLEIAHEGLQL